MSLRKQGEDRFGVGGHGKSARGIHVVRKGIHLSKNGGVHHLVGMIVAMLLRLEEGGVHGRLKGLVEGLVRVLVVELLLTALAISSGVRRDGNVRWTAA